MNPVIRFGIIMNTYCFSFIIVSQYINNDIITGKLDTIQIKLNNTEEQLDNQNKLISQKLNSINAKLENK